MKHLIARIEQADDGTVVLMTSVQKGGRIRGHIRAVTDSLAAMDEAEAFFIRENYPQRNPTDAD